MIVCNDKKKTIFEVNVFYMSLPPHVLLERLGNDTPLECEQLNLSRLEISRFPQAATFPKLQILNLSFNEFSHLNDIKEMKSLKVLKITDNHVNSLEEIVEIVSLQKLIASNNSICSVDAINALLNLETLIVSKNAIETINLEMPNLETLDISNNPIVNIHYLNTPKLKYLDLSQTKIQMIPDGFLPGNLNELNLSGIKLRNFDFLKHLKKLFSLNLSNCGIDDSLLQNLPRIKALREINLSMNPVEDISRLCIFENLEEISLLNTNIKRPASFHKLNNLALFSLDLDGSPITSQKSYINVIHRILPSLQYIDGVIAVNVNQENSIDQEKDERSRFAADLGIPSNFLQPTESDPLIPKSYDSQFEFVDFLREFTDVIEQRREILSNLSPSDPIEPPKPRVVPKVEEIPTIDVLYIHNQAIDTADNLIAKDLTELADNWLEYSKVSDEKIDLKKKLYLLGLQRDILNFDSDSGDISSDKDNFVSKDTQKSTITHDEKSIKTFDKQKNLKPEVFKQHPKVVVAGKKSITAPGLFSWKFDDEYPQDMGNIRTRTRSSRSSSRPKSTSSISVSSNNSTSVKPLSRPKSSSKTYNG
eukprot:TRINITY_DN3310_c0_g3_i5.p1 TRINITY_DN3310_c0_g3~~TRINITY_DN3310_c0_g3_i5.p1  ORF type:complete len:591 (+),score=139.55 TRINITY_DN3310_c0_g3_i5:547-2319(+)